jgi:choline-glycine betaine transporter
LSVNLRRIVGLLVVVLLIFFVITQPDAAANTLSAIGTILRNAAENIIHFFSKVVT